MKVPGGAQTSGCARRVHGNAVSRARHAPAQHRVGERVRRTAPARGIPGPAARPCRASEALPLAALAQRCRVLAGAAGPTVASRLPARAAQVSARHASRAGRVALFRGKGPRLAPSAPGLPPRVAEVARRTWCARLRASRAGVGSRRARRTHRPAHLRGEAPRLAHQTRRVARCRPKRAEGARCARPRRARRVRERPWAARHARRPFRRAQRRVPVLARGAQRARAGVGRRRVRACRASHTRETAASLPHHTIPCATHALRQCRAGR